MKYYALAISIVWMGMSSALASPNNSCQVDWPREFQPQEIQDLYVYCMPPVSAGDIKQGQYVSFDEDSSVDANGPAVIAQTLQEIKNVFTEPSETRLTFQQTKREFVNGQWQISQSLHNLIVQKFLFRGLTNLFNQEVKFFNLKSQTGYMSVPQAVQQQPNCGGLANCSQGMRFFQVNFIRVTWETPYDQPKKQLYELIFSPDMPLLFDMEDSGSFSFSQIFRGCTQATFTDQTNQIHILRKCQSVRDFSF